MNNNKFVHKPKNEQYIKEREEIFNFFNELLNINDTNNIVNVVDIDNDDVKNQIKSKKDLIFKIFCASHWGYYVALKKSDTIANELSIIRPIFKEFNYIITSKNISKKNENGEKIKTVQWHFNKKI
jgi:hypothetical protein